MREFHEGRRTAARITISIFVVGLTPAALVTNLRENRIGESMFGLARCTSNGIWSTRTYQDRDRRSAVRASGLRPPCIRLLACILLIAPAAASAQISTPASRQSQTARLDSSLYAPPDNFRTSVLAPAGIGILGKSGVPTVKKGYSISEMKEWNDTSSQTNASRRKYAWGGAVVGGLVAAGATAIYIAASDKEVVMSPLALVPVIAGGALLGAIIGAAIAR